MKRSLFVVLLVLCLSVIAIPQASRRSERPVEPNTAAIRDPQFGQRRGDPNPIEEKFEKEREKAINKERHESLKKDTDKLFKLATELKDGVDKSSKDMLSVEVIRKCEEIEKLAKNVREKMKGY